MDTVNNTNKLQPVKWVLKQLNRIITLAIGKANKKKVSIFFNSLSAVKSGTADKWPKWLMSLKSIVLFMHSDLIRPID